jgi:predicted metalloprotease with PDZ domain
MTMSLKTKWMRGARLRCTALALAAGLAATAPLYGQTTSYEVDLNDRADDRFKVTVHLEDLTVEDDVFQFAATAPGTYQVMDIGRYVSDFRAFDAQGRRLDAERVSTNQWRFGEPERVRTVRYAIAETWDTPVEEHPVYMMAGSSLEADHALISPHSVFGFPALRQNDPVRVRFRHPMEWRIGTALVPDEEHWYDADDYDHLVDSPFLMGRLSMATLSVGDVPVEVWVYSKTDVVQAEDLLGHMEAMLNAAGRFLEGLPVDRYAFLWHFEDVSQGAWEHSYSSEYVIAEPREWTDQLGEGLTDIAAHEFFHVVTPLNIHSEIIQDFDFEEPTPSLHIWLYEGVTEWAAHAMQIRTRLIGLEEYFGRLGQKVLVDQQYFDSDYSLSDLAYGSYSAYGQSQWGNIYMRGALVASLLDIRLLELSGGQSGLRELILELSERFGKDRPFPEDRLFGIIAEMTHPEVADFFQRYVMEAQPLPLAEYFAKVGVRYTEGPPPSFGLMLDASPEQVALRRAWLRLRPAA